MNLIGGVIRYLRDWTSVNFSSSSSPYQDDCDAEGKKTLYHFWDKKMSSVRSANVKSSLSIENYTFSWNEKSKKSIDSCRLFLNFQSLWTFWASCDDGDDSVYFSGTFQDPLQEFSVLFVFFFRLIMDCFALFLISTLFKAHFVWYFIAFPCSSS